MREKIKCNEMIDGGMQSKQEVSEEKKVLLGDVMDWEMMSWILKDDVMGWEAMSWIQSVEVPWSLRNCHSGRVCSRNKSRL